MLVTTSNKILNVVPTIQVDAGAGQTPANISDPDHSLTYTSGTSTGAFRISFGAQTDISYVAISGHNAVGASDATVNIKDGVTLIDTVTISRNHNLFFSFTLQDFTDLRIEFTVTPNNQLTTVSYIAAGTYLAVPRGEQAGYSRQWLKRHLTSQTSTNLTVGPTAVTQKRKSLKGSLIIPNQTIDFIETQWQAFIDFTFEQPFFIKEDDTKAESSYICYNPEHDAKANAQNRGLVDASMTFSVYNGL
jgi:hypothetical protein